MSREAFGKQDPFVVLTLYLVAAGSTERLSVGTAKTGVVDRGGDNPVWVLDNILTFT